MIQILCGCFLCGLLPSLLKSGYYPLCYGILDNFLSITKNSYSSRPLTRHHSYIFLIRVCDDHSATWHFYFSYVLLIFMNIKCQWDFIIVVQLWSCHDLHTADKESGLKGTAIADVVYSIQTGIRLNQGHHIEGNHPFRKRLLLKLWIPQRYIGRLKIS